MTLLHFFNYYIFQWFFFRLATVWDNDGNKLGYKILWGVVPLSGYNGRKYNYLLKTQTVQTYGRIAKVVDFKWLREMQLKQLKEIAKLIVGKK